MATNLYETLEIPRDASQEQIRKAYKRKALQTHPDRLPPTATASEKQASEENFRKVNNAYEVLNDPQNRKIYDRHGVWPPPEPEYERPASSHRSSHRYRSPPRQSTFPEPFYDDSFHFTDPFELFDSIFGEFNRSFGVRSSWPESPTARFHSHFGNILAAMERDMFSDFGMGPGFSSRSMFSSPFSSFPSLGAPGGRGGFASEGFYSQTINGVTHTVHKRRDWDGTEHEFRTYPDGRKVHTVNGIEQPNTRSNFLPPPDAPPPEPRNIPPPPILDSSRRQNNNSYLPPPPSYHSGNNQGFGNNHSSQGFIPPVAPQENKWHRDNHSGTSFIPPPAPQDSKWHRRIRSRTHSESPVSPRPHYDDGPVIPYSNEQPKRHHHWWQRN